MEAFKTKLTGSVFWVVKKIALPDGTHVGGGIKEVDPAFRVNVGGAEGSVP